MTYDEAVALENAPLDEQLRGISALAQQSEFRLFCAGHTGVIMDYMSARNLDAIDQIILAAHQFPKACHKMGILRSSYTARRYLKYWHNLRDSAHKSAMQEGGKSYRNLIGLYEEVRNPCAVLWYELTPHYSFWNGVIDDHMWPRPRWPSPKVYYEKAIENN